MKITEQTLAAVTPTPYQRPDLASGATLGGRYGWAWRPYRSFIEMVNADIRPEKPWADLMDGAANG